MPPSFWRRYRFRVFSPIKTATKVRETRLFILHGFGFKSEILAKAYVARRIHVDMAVVEGLTPESERYGQERDMGIRHSKLPTIAAVLSFCAIAGIAPIYAQSLLQNRITQAIRASEVQVVHGTVHPMVAKAEDQGELSGSTVIQDMTLVFRRSAAQEADLKNLLQQQQTPGSALYHQWLKPGEFAARYGVSSQDLAKVSAWLASQGFHVSPAPAGADRIHFSGTASQVEAAFHTRMHRYLLHGESHWANATEISLPQAIAGMTLGIRNLNTFRPRPHFTQHPVNAVRPSAASLVKPHYTLADQNGEVNLIAPADAQTIYDVTGLYNSSITGTGQTLAVVGQTDITKYRNDIKNFRLLSGLNANNLPTQIVVPNTGSAQVSAGDLTEADIDVEWSGAIAKDASILYVTVGGQGGTVFDALGYAIQTPLAAGDTKFVPVISISYGSCEPPPQGSGIQQFEQVLEQANAQGQTIVAASGDEGSADCDYSAGPSGAQNGLAVDYPGSSQYVTGVGGSSFSADWGDQSKYWSSSNSSNYGSALSYIPETTWNNTATALVNGQLSAGGGGASELFTKPSWQVSPGVPRDNRRDVPDVSLASDPGHDGYVLCTEADSNGTLSSTCVYPLSGSEVAYFPANRQGYLYGGTSIAAPQLAAMITLWNQKSGNTGGIGNANPILYLGAVNNPGAFHDITTGGNAVVCKQGSPNCVSGPNGYVMSCCSAGTGYDMATGLGSVDAGAVAAIWPDLPTVNASFSLLLSNATISVDPGGSQTTKVVLTPSGAGANSAAGFSGTVNLACSNLPAGVSCGFAPGSSVTLTPGASQTVTLTIAATTSTVATTTAANRSTPTPLHRNWPMQTAFAGIFGLSLLGFGKKRRLFRASWMTMLLLAAGLMAATALTACGSGAPSNPNTGPTNPINPPVTQTITVTGTSGATVASAQIQLTVT